MEKTTKYSHRFLARIVLETLSPLSVGAGEKDVMTDHIVARDVNGFPYIPGTAIAGILRHAMEEKLPQSFFGAHEENGSEIIFSSAFPVADGGAVIEGIYEGKETEYLKFLRSQLVRQHVRINERGTTDTGGKFDGEVVNKGARFCFEIEMVSENTDKQALFEEVISKMASCSFRIGSGTRSGYGEVKIVECKVEYLDLRQEHDLNAYLAKSSALNDKFWDALTPRTITPPDLAHWIEYKLTLKPDDFFLFGSGFGNENADMTPVVETTIRWNGEKPELEERNILIPGSSVKGALSHRTAYYFNKNNGRFVENQAGKSGNENEAVRELFGYVEEGQSDNQAVRGNVIISDVIQQIVEQTKILNHVAIDRFTGGAIDGALFTEEVIYSEKEFELTIYVHSAVDVNHISEEEIKKTPLGAFECALRDVANGMLPLGGGVNRGHGCFSGTVFRNGKPLN